MNRLLPDMSRSHASSDGDFAPVDAAAAEAPPNPLLLVLSLLRGRYWLAIVLALAGAALGGWLGYRSQKPIYESAGLIRIKPNLPHILYQSDQNGMLPMF